MKKVFSVISVLMFLLLTAAGLAEDGIWICSNCGKEVQGNYCPWCGHKKTNAFCQVCGAEYDSSIGYAFCNICGAPLDSKVSDVTVGQVISFGHYEQDNHTENGPEEILWIVKDIQNGRALLVSKDILDSKPYNHEWKEMTWENCTLRAWLNGWFIDAAFSMKEQAAIRLTNVDNSKAQGYSSYKTDGGNNTMDRVFLLSYHEAYDLYFSNQTDRMSAPTDYAAAQGAYVSKQRMVGKRGAGAWWLRSTGRAQTSAGGVYEQGGFDTNKNNDPHMGIRPALWIDLQSAEIYR